MAQIPPALHGLLGDDVGVVTLEALKRLIGLDESQWLEFKSDVDTSKTDRHEFALDVTSFANAGGGLLLVGITENSDRVASAVPGIATTTDDEVLRFEQILASKVQPPLPVTLARIKVDDDHDVVAIAIEAGPLAPHAVMDGTTKLSYPVRRGRSKTYLSEAEVADAYARRTWSAERRAAELDTLHTDHAAQLDTTHQAWLVVSLLPSGRGLGSLTATTATAWQHWLNDGTAWPQVPMAYEERGWDVRVGYRGLRAANTFGQAGPMRHAVLNLDGAGSAAASFLLATDTPLAEKDGRYANRDVCWVVMQTLNMVSLLAHHAHRSGAHGAADIAAQLVVGPETRLFITPAHRYVGSLPLDFTDITAQYVEIAGPSIRTTRTVPLGPLAFDTGALLRTAQVLALDLASQFGIADLQLVTESGQINEAVAQYSDLTRPVIGFAANHGIALT